MLELHDVTRTLGRRVTAVDRVSPYRAKPGKARARRAPLAVVDGWLRPLARGADPLFGLAARTPGIAGQALADAALTLAASPSAIALLLAAQAAALVLAAPALAPFTLACVAYWGILVSDLPTRDGDAALAGLGAAVPGGAARRYWRQFLAALLLGLMFTGVAALRLALADPVRAGALVSGVFAFAAFASFAGRTSATSRTFLSLLLFALYVSVNVSRGAWADIVGFHGNATAAPVLGWAGLGVLAVLAGHLWNRRAGMKGALVPLLAASFSLPGHAAPMLDASGFGPFTFGMPLAAVNAHLKTKIVATPVRLRANPACDYVPVRDFPGVAFVFIDDRLRRIDVARRGYRSADGVSVGDRQDDAMRKLKDAKREPLDHVPEGVALVRDRADRPNAIGYQFYGGELKRMIAGDKRVIRYAEGCE